MYKKTEKVKKSYKERGLRQVWHVILAPDRWGVPLLLTTKKKDAELCYNMAVAEYPNSQVVMFCKYMEVPEDFRTSYAEELATKISIYDPDFDDIEELFL